MSQVEFPPQQGSVTMTLQSESHWITMTDHLPPPGATVLVFDLLSGGVRRCDVGPDGELLFADRPNFFADWTHWQRFLNPVLSEPDRIRAEAFRNLFQGPPYRVYANSSTRCATDDSDIPF
jgi:hypothetical protein